MRRCLPWLLLGGGDFSSDLAGAASLAVAEVASSADIVGAASPADLAGMALQAVAGVASPADPDGMAFSAVAGLAFSADIATDLMVVADSFQYV